MNRFKAFTIILIILTFNLFVGCSDDSSSRSSNRTNIDPEEVSRLMKYEKWGKSLRDSESESDKTKRWETVSEMMRAMGSGEIPKDGAKDYENLSRKYYGK